MDRGGDRDRSQSVIEVEVRIQKKCLPVPCRAEPCLCLAETLQKKEANEKNFLLNLGEKILEFIYELQCLIDLSKIRIRRGRDSPLYRSLFDLFSSLIESNNTSKSLLGPFGLYTTFSGPARLAAAATTDCCNRDLES